MKGEKIRRMFQNKDSEHKIALPKGTKISVTTKHGEKVELKDCEFISLPGNTEIIIMPSALTFPGAECETIPVTMKIDHD